MNSQATLPRGLTLRVNTNLGGFTLAQQLKSYANFNSFTIAGRVFAADIVQNNAGEFLAVTLISNLSDGDDGVTVTFNNSNGIMGLFKKGFLPVGRMVTIIGHINGTSSTYVKDGQVYDRKRPNIHMTGVAILEGGLGPMPKDKQPEAAARRVPGRKPAVDQTPDLAAAAAANSDY